MIHPNTMTAASAPRRRFSPNIVSLNMANAMVGRTVDLLVGTHRVAHGVVSGVITEAGRPRIVVGRASYDVSQVLTITPA